MAWCTTMGDLIRRAGYAHLICIDQFILCFMGGLVDSCEDEILVHLQRKL